MQRMCEFRWWTTFSSFKSQIPHHDFKEIINYERNEIQICEAHFIHFSNFYSCIIPSLICSSSTKHIQMKNIEEIDLIQSSELDFIQFQKVNPFRICIRSKNWFEWQDISHAILSLSWSQTMKFIQSKTWLRFKRFNPPDRIWISFKHFILFVFDPAPQMLFESSEFHPIQRDSSYLRW